MAYLDQSDQQRALDAQWQFTLQMYGLHRPSRDGFLQIFRAVSSYIGPGNPAILAVPVSTEDSPDLLLSLIEQGWNDLRIPGTVVPWQLLPIDSTRAQTGHRALAYPTYIMVSLTHTENGIQKGTPYHLHERGEKTILGRTLLRVLVFGTLFWPHFGVPRQWFYPRERGCCRDQGWRCHFGSRFSWSFGCCISCCLGVFSGAILVAIPCLDRGWILAWSFGCLFCCCFGWPFRCCLGRCFALCFCVVGCLAPGLDPCVVVLVPVS